MSNLLNKLKVVIIGGGLSGISTANVLHKLGCRKVTVLERASSASKRSVRAGTSIVAANGVRVLDAVDLADKTVKSGQPLFKFTQRNTRSDLLASFNTSSVIHERIKNGDRLTSIAIQHQQLLSLLSRELPENTIQYATSVSAVERTEKGYEVKVDGAALDSAAHTADLIVGADGLYSTIRQNYVQKGGRDLVRSLGGILVTGISQSRELASSDQGEDELLELWGNGQRFGCCRLASNSDKIWWYATLHDSYKASTDSPTALSTALSSFPGKVAAIIAATPQSQYLVDALLELPPVTPFHRDGVVLVGSAAATLTIDYHQQAAQCLESAFTLGLSLLTSPSISQALDRYTRIRYPRLSFLSTAAYSETETAVHKSRLMASLRDMASSMMPKQVVNTTYESALSYNIFNDFPEFKDKEFKSDKSK